MKKEWKRILAFMLVFVLTCSIPEFGMQTLQRESSVVYTVVNPLYESVVSEEDLQREWERKDSAHLVYADTQEPTFSTVEEASVFLRKEMVKRQPQISFGYDGEPKNIQKECMEIFDLAIAHTGVGQEGDYLKWSYRGFRVEMISSSTGAVRVIFYISYLSTSEQEKEVTKKLKDVKAKLSLKGKSSYEKVVLIHDYIAEHVKYDYEHMNDIEYRVQFTPYGALLQGKAVCQGYASLFYRMALEAGVETRIATSTDIAHAWNIVKLNNKWYHLDVTWDSENAEHRTYFLKCQKNFRKHPVADEFVKKIFNTSDYVLSTENYNPKTAVPEYGSNIKKTGQTLISLEDCKLRLAKTKYEYNGKARTPAVEVSYQGKKVDASTYKVTYKNNKNSGAAVALVEGLEEKGYTGSVSLSFTIEKQVNTITCSASSFQRETASKKTSFSIGAKVKRGALSYKSNHAKVSINAKGMVTISPHFVGTVKIEIQSKEFANYKSAKKTITLQVNPKKSVKLSA